MGMVIWPDLPWRAFELSYWIVRGRVRAPSKNGSPRADFLPPIREQSGMITRFSGTNVGCFDAVSVDLEPLTVFIGPNASGKSTILRAIRALALLARSPLYDRKTKLLRLAGVATF